jgi:predicted kinase
VEPLVIVVPDPSLVVLVGPAGAGKSTFAARHFEPGEVLSSDAFRLLIAGDASDQRATRPAFGALHRALLRRSLAGRLTVVDATNVRAAARRSLVARAAAAGIPAIAIVLDLPAALVRARNASRVGGAVVPEAAVRAQLEDLGRALADPSGEAWRGFAAVHRLRTPDDVDRVSVVRVPRP